MIKAKTVNGDIFLGIDRENINRLIDAKPIFVKGSDLGTDNDIYIVFGETIEEIMADYNLPKIQ